MEEQLARGANQEPVGATMAGLWRGLGRRSVPVGGQEAIQQPHPEAPPAERQPSEADAPHKRVLYPQEEEEEHARYRGHVFYYPWYDNSEHNKNKVLF